MRVVVELRLLRFNEICFSAQIGLVEKEWLDTLASIDPGHVTYTDYVDCGRVLARNLKQVKGCNIVIALTHMRTPNDKRLAHQVEEIDLILGGHDHVSEFIQVLQLFFVFLMKHFHLIGLLFVLFFCLGFFFRLKTDG